MPPSQPINTGVILEKIENIQCDVGEIKTLLTNHVDAQIKFEAETLSNREVAKERMGALQAKVGNHEDRLEKVEKIVGRLAITDAILRWVALILMGSVITLIWGILTNQVTVNFP